jgi:hypothetical protein
MNITALLLCALSVFAAQPADAPAPEVYCGIEKPAPEDVQGPRLPGQVLYPTWPPAGVEC